MQVTFLLWYFTKLWQILTNQEKVGESCFGSVVLWVSFWLFGGCWFLNHMSFWKCKKRRIKSKLKTRKLVSTNISTLQLYILWNRSGCCFHTFALHMPVGISWLMEHTTCMLLCCQFNLESTSPTELWLLLYLILVVLLVVHLLDLFLKFSEDVSVQSLVQSVVVRYLIRRSSMLTRIGQHTLCWSDSWTFLGVYHQLLR